MNTLLGDVFYYQHTTDILPGDACYYWKPTNDNLPSDAMYNQLTLHGDVC